MVFAHCSMAALNLLDFIFNFLKNNFIKFNLFEQIKNVMFEIFEQTNESFEEILTNAFQKPICHYLHQTVSLFLNSACNISNITLLIFSKNLNFIKINF
jgi:hypothetical protein